MDFPEPVWPIIPKSSPSSTEMDTSVIASFWSVFASLAVCAAAGVPMCVVFAAGGSGAAGMAVLSAGIVCAGLSVFMFFGCLQATKGILLLTKKFAIWVKNCFIKKEEA